MLPHMQLQTWKHFGFTGSRCSNENGGAWWLTEQGFGRMRAADVVLVEADSDQRRSLALGRGGTPHHGSQHERLAFGHEIGAGHGLLVVDFFHAFDLVRGCCVHTWRGLARGRGNDACRSCAHDRAGHQGNE